MEIEMMSKMEEIEEQIKDGLKYDRVVEIYTLDGEYTFINNRDTSYTVENDMRWIVTESFDNDIIYIDEYCGGEWNKRYMFMVEDIVRLEIWKK